jgi:hypothetical protein
VVLARIDRGTGVATVIGSTGQPTVYGLAFLCCRLYGTTEVGQLVDINAASGAATVVGRNTLRSGAWPHVLVVTADAQRTPALAAS